MPKRSRPAIYSRSTIHATDADQGKGWVMRRTAGFPDSIPAQGFFLDGREIFSV
jgi:hypothetical protein